MAFHDVAPPAYVEKAPPQLGICTEYLNSQPMHINMRSKHNNPDWAVTVNNQPLFFAEIESIKLREKHEMQILDVRNGSRVFTIKRRTVNDVWRYSAAAPGKHGVKLLEFDSKQDLLSGSTSKLIFRNQQTDELDALELKIPTDTDTLTADVLYESRVIGNISFNAERSPEVNIKVEMPYVDPLLFVAIVLCIDDRMMSQRRRTRRGFRESSKRILRSDGTFMAAWYAFLL